MKKIDVIEQGIPRKQSSDFRFTYIGYKTIMFNKGSLK